MRHPTDRSVPWTRRRLPALVLLTGVAVLALLSDSCGKAGRKPVYPVRGQVMVGGRPAPQAFVVFHPVGDDDPQATRPYGHAGTDGSFTLTTYDPGDGAPAGDYVVTIVWPGPAAPNQDPPDRLKGRFLDPKTSPLRATVQKGPTEIEPFRLAP
jgi:hypothetical protein